MPSYRVLPLPAAVSDAVRALGLSPRYGHPAHREVATGAGPCRVCLSTFAVGADERTLFTYDPFEGLSGYPLPGPIFIHAIPCEPYSGAGFPEGLRALPLMIEAYGADREPLGRAPASGRGVDAVIEALLSRPGVEYLHVRHREAGCYVARIDRAEAPRQA